MAPLARARPAEPDDETWGTCPTSTVQSPHERPQRPPRPESRLPRRVHHLASPEVPARRHREHAPVLQIDAHPGRRPPGGPPVPPPPPPPPEPALWVQRLVIRRRHSDSDLGAAASSRSPSPAAGPRQPQARPVQWANPSPRNAAPTPCVLEQKCAPRLRARAGLLVEHDALRLPPRSAAARSPRSAPPTCWRSPAKKWSSVAHCSTIVADRHRHR